MFRKLVAAENQYQLTILFITKIMAGLAKGKVQEQTKSKLFCIFILQSFARILAFL